MRLLRAGKSWVDGKESAVRYRLGDGRAMPKFGSAKNPFRSTAKATLGPEAQKPLSPTLSPSDGEREKTEIGARTAPVRRNPESKLTPALLPERLRHSVVARAGTVRAPKSSGARGMLRGALSKVGWLVFGPRPNRAASPMPGLDKGPVQGELSLEKITPVRNDLSDADLEIVPAKPPASTPTPLPVTRGEGEVAGEVRSPLSVEPNSQENGEPLTPALSPSGGEMERVTARRI